MNLNKKYIGWALVVLAILIAGYLGVSYPIPAPPAAIGSQSLGVVRFNQAVQFLMPAAFSGSETHSGTETHTGAATFSGSTSLSGLTCTASATTLSGGITATNASIGGGYGSSGCDITSAGILQCNGAATLAGGADMNATVISNIGNAGTDFTPPGGLTLADGITATHAVIGGGYGSSGCTVLSTGVLECDGAADLAGGLNITGTVRVNSNTMNLGKIISGTVSNNGTIAHGLGAVPTYAVCSGWTSTSAPLTATVSISGAMNATNLRIGLGDAKNDAPWLGSIVVMCYVIP